ncbi:MAG: amidohydrolase [Alphaproteobacteria bacterium 65-7]|nr:MAG: amidohydrolase [Alphaproteobacteria bacterium 65-7]
MTGPVPFVDAHVHLWDLAHIRYPWLTAPFHEDRPAGSTQAIAVNYGLDDYLADAANWNVRAIVHVDAGADPRDALKETRWLQTMADARGMPNAIVAFAALDDPNLDALLQAHAVQPNVRGIRHIVGWHHDPARSYAARDVTADDAWARGFALLRKYNLSFDCQVYPTQFANMAALAARNPDIPVILNHLGMPILTDNDGEDVWLAGLKKLAALPQVCIKLSGVGFIHRRWNDDNIRGFILRAIDLFGVERCLFASDFPTDKLFGSFDAHLSAYHRIVAGFSDDERRALFGRNAVRFYRLGIAI